MGKASATINSLLLGGLLSVLLLVVVASSRVADLGAALDHLTEAYEMQTLTENVTRPDGGIVTVTTTRGADESIEEFIDRHDATVAALEK